jgi:hypothetical protein
VDKVASAPSPIRALGEGVPVADDERVDRPAVARLGAAALVLGAVAVTTATG